MNAPVEGNAVLLKTRELCAALVELPQFQTIRERIQRFAADESVTRVYGELNQTAGELQQKQEAGMPISPAEIAAFEALQERFTSNPLGREFIAAQQEMVELQELINGHISKTFELGRVPRPSDLMKLEPQA